MLIVDAYPESFMILCLYVHSHYQFLLQMAPDCEEDACKVEEGGRFRF